MITVQEFLNDPGMQAAIDELQSLILSHFPTTIFTVGTADDPEGVYMRAIVDVDDPDEVTEVFIDRMIDMQVEDSLPIYVLPIRTPERAAALRQQQLRAQMIPDAAGNSSYRK